jgi:hypothetical protein
LGDIMPSGDVHLKLDRLLRENRIIEIGDGECDEVHDRMDMDMYSYGGPWQHQDDDPHHTERGIRDWIGNGRDSFWDSLLHGVWGHRDCDFVRVALGHMVLDQYWAKYRGDLDSGDKTSDEVVELAFRNFLSRNFDKARSR